MWQLIWYNFNVGNKNLFPALYNQLFTEIKIDTKIEIDVFVDMAREECR